MKADTDIGVNYSGGEFVVAMLQLAGPLGVIIRSVVRRKHDVCNPLVDGSAQRVQTHVVVRSTIVDSRHRIASHRIASQ